MHTTLLPTSSLVPIAHSVVRFSNTPEKWKTYFGFTPINSSEMESRFNTPLYHCKHITPVISNNGRIPTGKRSYTYDELADFIYANKEYCSNQAVAIVGSHGCYFIVLYRNNEIVSCLKYDFPEKCKLLTCTIIEK
ncbi:MAG: hypothetical protein MUD00_02055 [Candidatus Pacebacteria bacterium]|jgi:hypothetical protein|nr:hypothetical protein [Candidatus Paceibacterota bacterium]